jgi:hypothetical protein
MLKSTRHLPVSTGFEKNMVAQVTQHGAHGTLQSLIRHLSKLVCNWQTHACAHFEKCDKLNYTEPELFFIPKRSCEIQTYSI